MSGSFEIQSSLQSNLRSNTAESRGVRGGQVFVERCRDYSVEGIEDILTRLEFLFAQTISRGDTVVIKPNWIAPHHKYRTNEWKCVITHPDLITAIIRKVVQHIGDSGRIVVADGPQTDSSFPDILKRMPVALWYEIGRSRGVNIEIIDLREMCWAEKDDIITNRTRSPGDPLGSVEFDLGDMSAFANHTRSSRGYYGADYDSAETNRAHTNGHNHYRVSRTAIEADVFINVPKLKTHKKAGITCSLKNLVGINTYKNFIPHYSLGTARLGGDQYPGHDAKSFVEFLLLGWFKEMLLKHEKHHRAFAGMKTLGRLLLGDSRETIRNGNWFGNDTLWRSIVDLNKVLLYGNCDGILENGASAKKKRYLSFIDAIISGEGNGPEAPEPLKTEMIIAGTNPVSTDCVAAKLMGFDYLKIPVLRNSFQTGPLKLTEFAYEDIAVRSSTIPFLNGRLTDVDRRHCFSFKPALGWTGHIESRDELKKEQELKRR